MIPVLYEKDELDKGENAFFGVGIGFLPAWIKDTIEVVEVRQGEFYLQGELPVGGLNVEFLAPERIILAAPAPGQRAQPFRIRSVGKPDENNHIRVLAQHISYQLNEHIVKPLSLRTAEAQFALDWLLGAGRMVPPISETGFTFESDIELDEPVQVEITDKPISARAFLGGSENCMANLFGGELDWDRKTVRLLASRGRNTGKVIRYGKELQSISFETSTEGLVTGYWGWWKKDGLMQTVTEPIYTSNVSDFAYPRVLAVDLSDLVEPEEGAGVPTQAQLDAALQDYADSHFDNLLRMSITFSIVPDDLQDVLLCDIVTVEHPDYSIQQMAKVVKTVFDPIREKYKSITVGAMMQDITDMIAGMSGGASYSSGGGYFVLPNAVLVTPMTLTENEKAIARRNIGAAAIGDIPTTYVRTVNGMSGDVRIQGGGASYYVLAEDIGLTTEWPTVPADATAEEQEAIAEQKAEIAAANSAALNQFIASSAAAKTVRFGAGTYHFGNTIRITTQTSFVGNGRETVLKFSGSDLFLDCSVYYAPHFYDLILSGVGYGTCLKIGTRAAGSDRSKDVTSARGIFFDVRVEHFDYGMRFESGWGWSFYSLDALDIRQFLFHGVGVWNTCNIIGGEYEYQAKGGVLWDDGCTCNAVNFIGVIWESLESHVFAVSPRAGNVNATIHGCYFENKYDYENRASSAHLIYSPNAKATFSFEGYTSIGYNQVIYSKGLVRNPPQNALLALSAFHQAFEVPTSRFSAVQSPSYGFPHGEVIDLDRDFEADTILSPASDLFQIDARGLHFQALNASFVTHKEQFAAGTPVRQLRLRIPEGLFDLSTVDIGFEFVVPDGVALESGMSIYCRVMGSQTFASVSPVSGKNPAEEGWYEKDAADNYVLSEDTAPASGKTYYSLNSWSSSQELALNRYVPMLGSDVIGVWRRYQAFKRYRSAVTAPSVTINGRKYYEIQMSVNAAEVGISKVFIDDGKRYHVPRSLYDAELKAMQTRLDAVEEMASPYKVLEYLESDGASWIDTGVLPSEDLQLRVQFQLASPESSTLAERQYVFGAFARDASNNVESRFQFYYGGSQLVDSTNIFVGWGSGARGVGYQYLFPKASDATLRVANMDAGTFYLSGTERAKFENPVFTTPVPIFLFACNENGTPNRFSNGMRITKARFFRDGELIADFVPRLRKADDMAGMLDLVSGTFHANRGTGTFLHD